MKDSEDPEGEDTLALILRVGRRSNEHALAAARLARRAPALRCWHVSDWRGRVWGVVRDVVDTTGAACDGVYVVPGDGDEDAPAVYHARGGRFGEGAFLLIAPGVVGMLEPDNDIGATMHLFTLARRDDAMTRALVVADVMRVDLGGILPAIGDA